MSFPTAQVCEIPSPKSFKDGYEAFPRADLLRKRADRAKSWCLGQTSAPRGRASQRPHCGAIWIYILYIYNIILYTIWCIYGVCMMVYTVCILCGS